jgi:hypothetical protein
MTKTKTNIETYTLVSANRHAQSPFAIDRAGVEFRVDKEADTVTVAYFPNGLRNPPDHNLGILLEGEPNEVNIGWQEPLTCAYAKKVWNRFLEIGFVRL